MNPETHAARRMMAQSGSGGVFPELAPPDEAGRAYPVWRDAGRPSLWSRLVARLPSLPRRRRAVVALSLVEIRRAKSPGMAERGSGSW